MPELPEVESVRVSLVDASPPVLGAFVRSVEILRESVIDGGGKATFLQTVTNSQITEIRRHGKYLFIRLNRNQKDDTWIALHLRMTGNLFYLPDNQPLGKFTRLVFYISNGMSLRFEDMRAFGRVWLVDDPSEVTERLGPDALTVPKDVFIERLKAVNRQLKPLLLDQEFVSGIGNIYADEILFRARLHPLVPSRQLDLSKIILLFESMRAVLGEAVRLKGANVDGSFKSGSFIAEVYGRTGNLCPGCGIRIIKIKVGQRGTHICPSCQRL